VAESVEPPRERGIWAPLGVLILLSYLAQVPLFRILIPFPVPLVALAPLVAAAALAGWFREGGFPALPIFWVGTSVALLGRLLQVGGTFAPLAGGWLLLLALAFTVRLVRWPDRPMLVQAGWSVAATAAATLRSCWSPRAGSPGRSRPSARSSVPGRSRRAVSGRR